MPGIEAAIPECRARHTCFLSAVVGQVLAEDSPAEAKSGRPAALKCGVPAQAGKLHAECGVNGKAARFMFSIRTPQSSIRNFKGGAGGSQTGKT